MTARLAADVGGTWLRVALLDGDRIIERHKVALEDRTVSSVLGLLDDGLRAVGASAGVPLGLAVAGFVDREGRVVRAPNLDWSDVPLAREAKTALGRTVVVVNDLNAAVWGERTAGAARGADDVVMVSIGSGVGSGLISGGRLVVGAMGTAAELGHTRVLDDGPECPCGGRGCLETLVGGHALVRRAAEKGLEVEDAAELAARYAVGNATAVELVEAAEGHLGRAVANLCTLMGPSYLVLSGSVLKGISPLRRAIVRAVGEETLAVTERSLRIVDATLGDEAGLVGAGALAEAVEKVL